MPTKFLIAMRGYDIKQVDRLLARADEAIASGTDAQRTSARDDLTNAEFTQRLRGYARIEVDEAIRDRLTKLA
jgi:DivIVA domain-containing protein